MAQQNITIGTADAKAGDTLFSAFTKTQANFTELYDDNLSSTITVNQSNVEATLGGVIDSTKVYLIDGVIDMTGITVTVPSGGLSLVGVSFDVSKLVCNDINYTMFVSPVGGSGNILGKDYAIEVTGSNSSVYSLTSATGFDAFEFARINYNDCTSLGEITNYRQGLETGTGRFGGTPELTLSGTWVGGYFIDTSIVRSIDSGSYSLFKAGASFMMSSRFRSNQNIDLPTGVSFFDFSPAHFPNPSTVQLDGVIMTRNGVFSPSDPDYTPNMTKGDLSSSWTNNNGMPNTFEGGTTSIDTEATTVVSVADTFYNLNAGAWNTFGLQHFDTPSGGQLRHLGNTPREYKVIADFTMESIANGTITLRVSKYNAATASVETVIDQTRQVNSLVGTRDIAFFNININVELDQNDYIFLQVATVGATSDITAEKESYYIVEAR